MMKFTKTKTTDLILNNKMLFKIFKITSLINWIRLDEFDNYDEQLNN